MPIGDRRSVEGCTDNRRSRALPSALTLFKPSTFLLLNYHYYYHLVLLAIVFLLFSEIPDGTAITPHSNLG